MWGGDFYRYERASDNVKKRVDEWKQFCAARGVSLQAAALAFAFRVAVIDKVTIGMVNEAQVRANVALCNDAALVEESFWQEAKTARLL